MQAWGSHSARAAAQPQSVAISVVVLTPRTQKAGLSSHSGSPTSVRPTSFHEGTRFTGPRRAVSVQLLCVSDSNQSPFRAFYDSEGVTTLYLLAPFSNTQGDRITKRESHLKQTTSPFSKLVASRTLDAKSQPRMMTALWFIQTIKFAFHLKLPHFDHSRQEEGRRERWGKKGLSPRDRKPGSLPGKTPPSGSMVLLLEASSCPAQTTSCLESREVHRKAMVVLSAPCPLRSHQCRHAEVDGLNLRNEVGCSLEIQAVQYNT